LGLIDILIVVLIVLACVLIAYLIVTLKKVNENLGFLQRDLNDINDRLNPILENLNEITKKTLNISSEAEEQVEKVKDFINSFGSGVTKFKSIKAETDPGKRIPLLIKNVSAVVKGVSVFLRELKT
jgi:uncharacterized protein YoxC